MACERLAVESTPSAHKAPGFIPSITKTNTLGWKQMLNLIRLYKLWQDQEDTRVVCFLKDHHLWPSSPKGQSLEPPVVN